METLKSGWKRLCRPGKLALSVKGLPQGDWSLIPSTQVKAAVSAEEVEQMEPWGLLSLFGEFSGVFGETISKNYVDGT